MATVTTGAATSSIAEPKGPAGKKGGFPAPARHEGGRTVRRSILSGQNFG